jgi:ATP-dependent exoDNAse (exonuclease V) alpha subunit
MSIFNHFKHLNLSKGQETALTKLVAFIDGPVPVFMLKGYAGSGKTTILKGLVDYLSDIEKDFVLMAPTGRAAKVIREKTGQEAFTIHKSIYSGEIDSVCWRRTFATVGRPGRNKFQQRETRHQIAACRQHQPWVALHDGPLG